ncbi:MULTISPECIES: cation diffusion facilitator family transporter [Edwardsiella]|uniref:Cation efflux family protein n=2 Tax=Edwardsiella anguillarum TaxID=1821960 RepID=A0A076LXN5_9GAMM|nr:MULTISPECIES: cation diffusion facilitator family transporter [Edwardsiella]AKM47878.1 cobalt transporter [Edwardsiella sp. EA181011]GAJ68868.1 cation diffusion facilitator family transporter [Edwardsiella piscicida]AIJ10189.1 cation efflux family protein [Edwardsiella anguillarum ET080813]AKR77759.1 cation diffusion facilitator family transporter [Edwardsiella sp. LADL05-105]KAB0592137.1 cation transporter [Edwardsiella anguillarum]
MSQPQHMPFSRGPSVDQSREAASKRSTWISVVVNIALTVFQIVAGVFSGSQGLIADGLHSLSDLAADFVVLCAVQRSQRAPDVHHHYGHRRYENAASLILGGLLLAVGIGMIVSAINKLSDPAAIPRVHYVALGVAVVALLAKEILFRYMLAVAHRVGSGMLVANAWHARSDAASSLVVAIGIAGNLLGFGLLDPIAALIVGVIVSRMGWRFSADALHDLTDRAADAEQNDAIRRAILSTPGVIGLHALKTRKSGDLILVDVHLEIDGRISITAGHHIASEAERRVMAEHPVLCLMTHVDPVVCVNANG